MTNNSSIIAILIATVFSMLPEFGIPMQDKLLDGSCILFPSFNKFPHLFQCLRIQWFILLLQTIVLLQTISPKYFGFISAGWLGLLAEAAGKNGLEGLVCLLPIRLLVVWTQDYRICKEPFAKHSNRSTVASVLPRNIVPFQQHVGICFVLNWCPHTNI